MSFAVFDINLGGQLLLRSSLIDQPGVEAVRHAGGPGTPLLESAFNVVNTLGGTGSLSAADTTSVAVVPKYFNRGDFRLIAGSTGVDFAPSSTASSVDRVNAPRTADLALQDNIHGPDDVGAFEQHDPELVQNGGFTEDFFGWSVGLHPFLAAGAAGVLSPIDTAHSGRVLVQCVPIVKAGGYRIAARATVEDSLDVPDSAHFRWSYHGNVDCDGDGLIVGEVAVSKSPGFHVVEAFRTLPVGSVAVAYDIVGEGTRTAGLIDDVSVAFLGHPGLPPLLRDGFELR